MSLENYCKHKLNGNITTQVSKPIYLGILSEKPMHPSQLAEIFESIQRPGKFYAAGAAEIYMPSLEVEGVGQIALPLLPIQAEQLVKVAERAPYGKGEETLIDTDVRRTWQIGADKVRISGKYWQQNLEEIVAWVANKLGVNGSVNAELYKLLVYDTGSFFVSHRDTEKSSGMFATLVIVLPSNYAGGELLVRHRGEESRLNLNVTDPSEIAYAAFYADCRHEVLPVTSGCRLTLIYNLLRTDQSQPLEPPDYGSEQSRLADWLRTWGESLKDEENDVPQKLIYPLEHAYTQAELSFAALKGADAARGTAAVAAAEQADCDLHLALITIEESGYAEYNYNPYHRGRYYDGDEEDEFEIGEVTDSYQMLTNWRKPDDSQPAFAELPFEDDEVCLPVDVDTLEPDELEFEEATGNAGASFERTYRRAALIFWPRFRRLAVLNQAGISVNLPYLSDLATRWKQFIESSLWQEAHELSGHMLRTWSKPDMYSRSSDQPGDNAAMLNALFRLQDKERVDAFLVNITVEGNYGKGDNENIVQAMDLLPPQRAAELTEQIIAHNMALNPGACSDLLARCALADWSGERPTSLVPAALALFKGLPGDPNIPTPTEYWQKPSDIYSSFVVNLMTAVERIAPDLACQSAECILSRPVTYGFDNLLVPALLTLSDQTGVATHRLRNACLEHLGERIAKTLEPPKDWTRDSTVICKCRHCSELSEFLADPSEKEWFFKAVQQERTHMEDSIKKSGCDLTLTTIKKGSPHTLACVKNQATYERRVQQRKKDLEHQLALQQANPDSIN